MTISNEAVEAAVREVDRFVYKPPADELPSIEGHKNALMRAVLEAAAPYMLSAPEGVSEAKRDVADLIGRIIAARDDFKNRDMFGARYLADILAEAADALSSERERAERAEKERDEARAGMAYILDRAEYGDSYGVPGSSFTACHFCQGGGAPGAEMIHDPSCPVAKYPSEVSEWFAEMTDAESRAQAAEAKVREAAELLDTFGRMLNEDHDNLPDELVVSLTYDDTAYDDDLGGPNTLLGELFLRVFRNARSAALLSAARDEGRAEGLGGEWRPEVVAEVRAYISHPKGADDGC